VRTGRQCALELAGLQERQPWAALWQQMQGVRMTPGCTSVLIEPVTMLAGMNNVSMRALASPLTTEQLATLQALLTPLFAAVGARLMPGPHGLIAEFQERLALSCRPLEDCEGVELRDCLPQGPDAGALRRLLTECQMVLHQAGETEAGLPEDVTGIWAWGEGALPLAERTEVRLLSADPLLAALDRALNPGEPTISADPLTAAARGKRTRALARDLIQGAPRSDVIWHDLPDLPGLEVLVEGADIALRKGYLERVTLAWWPEPGQSAQGSTVRRRDLAAFWRGPAGPWHTP
jgi:hypothetical protein